MLWVSNKIKNDLNTKKGAKYDFITEKHSEIVTKKRLRYKDKRENIKLFILILENTYHNRTSSQSHKHNRRRNYILWCNESIWNIWIKEFFQENV